MQNEGFFLCYLEPFGKLDNVKVIFDFCALNQMQTIPSMKNPQGVCCHTAKTFRKITILRSYINILSNSERLTGPLLFFK